MTIKEEIRDIILNDRNGFETDEQFFYACGYIINELTNLKHKGRMISRHSSGYKINLINTSNTIEKLRKGIKNLFLENISTVMRYSDYHQRLYSCVFDYETDTENCKDIKKLPAYSKLLAGLNEVHKINLS